MKDKVKARMPAKREIETECDIIDNGKDEERTMPVRGKFQGGSKGRHMFAHKPNLIADGKKGEA